MNNNQMMQADNAAVRVARLPVLRSAWSRLTVLYTGAKRSRPNVRLFCEALEHRAVHLCTLASDTVSPVVVVLEPQISIANEFACKSLDWLESAFPLLQAPTEEIVAVAKDKIHEAKEMMNAVATRSKSCLQRTLEHPVNQEHSSSFSDRAAAGAGLDHAPHVPLVDSVSPSAVGGEEANSVEGFDSTSAQTERLQSLCTNLYRGYNKVIERLSQTSLTQELQTHLSSFIMMLPHCLQQQMATMILFVAHMYSLSCPFPQQTGTEYSILTTTSPHKDQLAVVQWQESPTWRLRLPQSDCGCKDHCCMRT
ncbi:unnamed protein product [Knipowitschia caucasica]|uniref:Uncharacterized protein n=1 Tax=Knipowitschia caucasica TaxID=637954 RepID=A0AAV2LG96_KNICA